MEVMRKYFRQMMGERKSEDEKKEDRKVGAQLARQASRNNKPTRAGLRQYENQKERANVSG